MSKRTIASITCFAFLTTGCAGLPAFPLPFQGNASTAGESGTAREPRPDYAAELKANGRIPLKIADHPSVGRNVPRHHAQRLADPIEQPRQIVARGFGLPAEAPQVAEHDRHVRFARGQKCRVGFIADRQKHRLRKKLP